MSIKLMSEIWQHSPAKGTRLLLLLAIADHANDEGIAWPGVESLARKCRMSSRNVQYLLRELEREGSLFVTRREGKTHLFRVAGVKPIAGVQPTAPEGEAHCTPGVKPTAPESSLNHQRTTIHSRSTVSDEPPKRPVKRKRKPDPRTNHPAIQAVRDVTNRYPPKPLWGDIIKLLGDEPRVEEMRLCFKEWVKPGFKPTNFAWLFDWYVSGIPPRAVRHGSVQQQTADAIRQFMEDDDG